jgi:hypothetical protein
MGKKLISKNHLTLPPPPFLLRFRLKINKNQGIILGKHKLTQTFLSSLVEIFLKIFILTVF